MFNVRESSKDDAREREMEDKELYQKFLRLVKDEEVPRMLFLSVNPTRAEGAEMEVASTPTYTDGAAVGVGGFVLTTPDVSSDGPSDSTGRLLSKFRIALQEQSISPVRRELHLRLLKLSTLHLQDGDLVSTLESNFSDENDQLSTDEEDVLEFTEIFERFQYPVPEEIKNRFDAIVANKKISIQKSEGGKKKTFFVYAENKILMKVCDSLTPLEVHEMYRIVKEMKGLDEDVEAMKEVLTLPYVELEALEKVAGLKDVVFFYLVLSLMRKKMMNRLYTHKLVFLLEQLQEIHMKSKNQENPNIARSLASLDRYPIASQPPGLCLIFHMTEDRLGADEDLKLVKDLFENVLKYDVVTKVDPKAEQIKFIISKLKADRNKFYDSLVVWFMGHGSKSYLKVKGGHIHKRVELIKPFTEIEWFYKKPKLFFIQACAVKENRKRFSSWEWFLFLYILTPLLLLLCVVQLFDQFSVFPSALTLVPGSVLVGLAYLAWAALPFLALSCTSSASGGDLKRLSAQTDSVGWKAAAGDVWQEKYADYTDVSNINSFADTLISYATMWYQPAARAERGSLYVDTLVDQLKQYGSKESIENVLRRVHYNVNTVSLLEKVPGQGEVSWKQAPYFESSLQKAFMFPKTANQ